VTTWLDLPWWSAIAIPAFIVALLAWPLSTWLLQRNVVDHPDQSRRLHRMPTPRGGGLAIAVGLWLGLCLIAFEYQAWDLLLGLSLFIAGVTLLGFWEDWKPRPVVPRLLAQCLLAAAIVWGLGPIHQVGIGGFEWTNPWLWSVLGFVAIIWLMNIHNFMDGSDGLAAVQGIWTGGCYSLVFGLAGQPIWAGLSLTLLGSCLGFLFWNRPVARLFMGDSGSLLLGGIVGLLAYRAVASGAASLVVCVVISAVFVVDATATLVWRVLSGERWYTAHASHAFQRLISGGYSHGHVLPTAYLSMQNPTHELWLSLVLISALMLGWWRIQRQNLNHG